MQKLRAFPDPPRLKGWADARKTRDDTNGDKPNVEAAHRSCTPVNPAATAICLGRPLCYDPDREVFENDEVANRMINPPMRGP